MVRPELVLIPNGRGKHDNPQSEVVKAIKRFGAKIACSQMNRECCRDKEYHVPHGAAHLVKIDTMVWRKPEKQRARETRHQCAGSFHFRIGETVEAENDMSLHEAYLDERAPSRLCSL